ncbi:hypothetical protein BD311DRAFT_677867 [Dichomitus squalens]|uniref:Uncharacterized protein n=1 Tax=Dichomitus squalens TaxID=114155 RepID=A0A4Q9M4D5_9APHY|nr:hypothetical protein BD311DRAFT_677867 [Dichomitus squalens]
MMHNMNKLLSAIVVLACIAARTSVAVAVPVDINLTPEVHQLLPQVTPLPIVEKRQGTEVTVTVTVTRHVDFDRLRFDVNHHSWREQLVHFEYLERDVDDDYHRLELVVLIALEDYVLHHVLHHQEEQDAHLHYFTVHLVNAFVEPTETGPNGYIPFNTFPTGGNYPAFTPYQGE